MIPLGIVAYTPPRRIIAAGPGAAAGRAVVSGVGVALFPAQGAADGRAVVAGVGSTTGSAAGAAAGQATVAGVGASTFAGAGAAAGHAGVSGTGAATFSAAGSAAGLATVSGISGNDANYSSVVLLTGFNGTNGSTAFIDESPVARTLTTVGNAQVSTSSPPYGTGWGLFDGSGDRITAPFSSNFNFGSGDFTVELTVNLTTKTTSQAFCGVWDQQIWFFFIDAGNLKFRVNGGAVDVVHAWTPTLGTTYRVCAERAGSTLRMYIDGAMVVKNASYTTTINAATTAAFVIGAIGNGGAFSAYDFKGEMDELRITKGVARYASDAGYTVATSAFPRA